MARMGRHGAELVAERSLAFVIPESVSQMYHIERRMVHLSVDKLKSVCGHLVALSFGEMDVSVTVLAGPYVIGSEDLSFGFCRLCYGCSFGRTTPVSRSESSPASREVEECSSVSSSSASE